MTWRGPVLAVALALALVAGCGGSGGSAVASVSTSPWPEGATGPTASRRSGAAISVPLDEVARDIPSPLPANPPQTCRYGPEVEITLESGRRLTYGPCERPASIERLRRALIWAAERAHPPAPEPPVSGPEWKGVLNDWYTGTMLRWHRCAAVREAIRHLPADPARYSTVSDDLDAYAQAVCWPPRP